MLVLKIYNWKWKLFLCLNLYCNLISCISKLLILFILGFLLQTKTFKKPELDLKHLLLAPCHAPSLYRLQQKVEHPLEEQHLIFCKGCSNPENSIQFNNFNIKYLMHSFFWYLVKTTKWMMHLPNSWSCADIFPLWALETIIHFQIIFTNYTALIDVMLHCSPIVAGEKTISTDLRSLAELCFHDSGFWWMNPNEQSKFPASVSFNPAFFWSKHSKKILSVMIY